MTLHRRIRKLEDRLRPPASAPPLEEYRAALNRRWARIDVELGTYADGVVPTVLVNDTPERRRRDEQIEERWREASGFYRIRRDSTEIEALRNRVSEMLSRPPDPKTRVGPDPPSH